jgi:hypothetical protein
MLGLLCEFCLEKILLPPMVSERDFKKQSVGEVFLTKVMKGLVKGRMLLRLFPRFQSGFAGINGIYYPFFRYGINVSRR